MMVNDGPRIMVVDDNEGMRVTLEAIVEDEGYLVTGVDNGHRAIELVQGAAYDLVFMDIKMPGINGVDTYREIKKLSPGSVVVMMTGFSVEDLVKEALDEGAYAVIYKPFAAEQIIDIMRAALKTALVLVVDDRAADRETLRAVLEDSGYRVSTAQDGNHAIHMARERHYHAILMDIGMPGMDGITAFEEIRKEDPLVKVILIPS